MTSGTDAAPTFTRHYEALRAWALAAPPPPRPPGLALVLHRGLPTWLVAWPTWHPPQRARDSTVDPRAAGRAAPTARDRTLTHVLATMVERCQREGER